MTYVKAKIVSEFLKNKEYLWWLPKLELENQSTLNANELYHSTKPVSTGSVQTVGSVSWVTEGPKFLRTALNIHSSTGCKL